MDLDVLNVIYTILCYTMYSTKQVQENKVEENTNSITQMISQELFQPVPRQNPMWIRNVKNPMTDGIRP